MYIVVITEGLSCFCYLNTHCAPLELLVLFCCFSVFPVFCLTQCHLLSLRLLRWSNAPCFISHSYLLLCCRKSSSSIFNHSLAAHLRLLLPHPSEVHHSYLVITEFIPSSPRYSVASCRLRPLRPLPLSSTILPAFPTSLLHNVIHLLPTAAAATS